MSSIQGKFAFFFLKKKNKTKNITAECKGIHIGCHPQSAPSACHPARADFGRVFGLQVPKVCARGAGGSAGLLHSSADGVDVQINALVYHLKQKPKRGFARGAQGLLWVERSVNPNSCCQVCSVLILPAFLVSSVSTHGGENPNSLCTQSTESSWLPRELCCKKRPQGAWPRDLQERSARSRKADPALTALPCACQQCRGCCRAFGVLHPKTSHPRPTPRSRFESAPFQSPAASPRCPR